MFPVFLAAALAAASPAVAPPLAAPPVTVGPQVNRKMGFIHGSDIIARCTDDSPQQGSFCLGFIAAVYETVRAYETWMNIREICMPNTVSLIDMRGAVIDHIKRVPDDRLGQGASVVLIALKAKWPCA